MSISQYSLGEQPLAQAIPPVASSRKPPGKRSIQARADATVVPEPR